MKHILGTQELVTLCVMTSLTHWGSPIGGLKIKVPFLTSFENGPCPVICFGQWNKWEWKGSVSLPASVFILTPSHTLIITGALSLWRHSPPTAMSDYHQQSSPIECGREWGANLCYRYVTKILELFVTAAEPSLRCPTQSFAFSQKLPTSIILFTSLCMLIISISLLMLLQALLYDKTIQLKVKQKRLHGTKGTGCWSKPVTNTWP